MKKNFLPTVGRFYYSDDIWYYTDSTVINRWHGMIEKFPILDVMYDEMIFGPLIVFSDDLFCI